MRAIRLRAADADFWLIEAPSPSGTCSRDDLILRSHGFGRIGVMPRQRHNVTNST
jgi:hypothetical protein